MTLGVGCNVVIYLAGLQDVPQDSMSRRDWAADYGVVSGVTSVSVAGDLFQPDHVDHLGTQVLDIPTSRPPTVAQPTTVIAIYLYDSGFRFLRMGYASHRVDHAAGNPYCTTAAAFWSTSDGCIIRRNDLPMTTTSSAV
jgi:hypothetical protein